MNALPLSMTGITAGLLLIEFACSLVESCIRNLTPAETARFAVHHELTAKTLQRFRENRLLPLTTIALVQYPSLVFGLYFLFSLSGTNTAYTSPTAVALYSYLLIFCGFVLPRALGNRYREPLAFLFAIPLRLATILFAPLAWPLILVCRRLDTSAKADHSLITDDIVMLSREAASKKALSRQQAHLIARSIALSTISAADIMVDRSEIRPIADRCSLAEAMIEAHHHHHTRFPLTHEGDLNQIIGYVNFKDIVGALRLNPADPTLYGIRRPIESVEASTPLPELLQLFTRGRQHIVIVKDAGGSTLGMVTLEDLLEVLVGDLEDEYDTPPDFVVQLGAKRFCAGGGTTFSELRTRIAPVFPDWDVTISEWLLAQTDGTIQEKFTADFEHFRFTVRKVSRGKVFDVLIDREQPPESSVA